MENLQPVLDLLRQISHILPVLRREQHRFNARSECANQFLLDTSDGGDSTSEGYLALRTTDVIVSMSVSYSS